MQPCLVSIRLLALFALGVSTAQLADQLSGAGAFCEFGGGCEQVTRTTYGRPLGIPLPVVGITGFALLFSATFIPHRRERLIVRIMAIVGGMIALGLLAIQFFVLETICPLCLMVDSSAILIAALSLAPLPEPRAPSRYSLLAWIVAAALAVVIPVCWSVVVLPDPVPDEVRALWVPGKVTIVEVTDFECPYCRKADPILHEVLGRNDVHFVRVVAPMPNHLNGMPAGRAYLAAVAQRKGEAMAAALFATDSRAAAKCRELAAKLELNMEQYDRDVNDPATDTTLQNAVRWAKETNKGLPLIWVQEQVFFGVAAPEALEAAIHRAVPPK
jgi:uncharacterized membrane protein/protein-disulfide isomerase